MWDEIADGAFRRRYESLDLNVGVVIGGEGVLVIDTRASHRQAQQLLDELATLTDLPPRWVLNTHYHWDHCWGNALFPSAQVWGHERCRAALMNDGELARKRVLEWMPEEHHADVEEVVVTAPDHTFGIRHAIDLGGRIVEFKYLGSGSHRQRCHCERDRFRHGFRRRPDRRGCASIIFGLLPPRLARHSRRASGYSNGDLGAGAWGHR